LTATRSKVAFVCFTGCTGSGQGAPVRLISLDTQYTSPDPQLTQVSIVFLYSIGQTREVHIFRLVTEHTVEENILLKAKQKRNLDILVMDKGNFDASQLECRPNMISNLESDPAGSLYTTGGLRDILGVDDTETDESKGEDVGISSDQLEKTMTSLEDVEDANALRGARKEAAEELQEFDESIEYKKDSDGEDDEDAEKNADSGGKNGTKAEESKNDEKELEKEFAAWQDKVGMDASAIEETLSPVERYCLRFHETVDPYYSVFAVMDYQRKMEANEEKNEEMDIDEIETEKAVEELRAFEEGELLCTFPRPEDLIRQRNLYHRERRRLLADKKRRKLTGEDWECKIDEASQHLFWYSIDTGEAVWDKPKVIVEMEAYDLANQQGWAFLPIKPLILTMGFLSPYPDRMRSSEVCTHWRKGARHVSFVRHVYPVEQGAYTMDERKMEHNHYRTIEDALKIALPGDTIGKSYSLERFTLDTASNLGAPRTRRWSLLAKLRHGYHSTLAYSRR
jgi:hypothetical protein